MEFMMTKTQCLSVLSKMPIFDRDYSHYDLDYTDYTQFFDYEDGEHVYVNVGEAVEDMLMETGHIIAKGEIIVTIEDYRQKHSINFNYWYNDNDLLLLNNHFPDFNPYDYITLK